MGMVQLVLGAPFLLENPVAYIHRSFDLGRMFLYKWTVNFKFLPEDVFLSKQWGVLLLLATVILWLLFFLPWGCRAKRRGTTAHSIALALYTANFVGVACARTLHYQFYCWYSFSLPFLTYSARWSGGRADWAVRVLILAAVELSFNWPKHQQCATQPLLPECENPATPISSAVLNVAHAVLLLGLCRAPAFGLQDEGGTREKAA